MGVWQSIALGFLMTALTALKAAIKNEASRLKYRSYCLDVVRAAVIIKAQFPDDPDFQ